MEGETETKKEKRETAALTRKMFKQLRTCMVWVRLGMGKHALRCWKPLEKENHLDCSQEPLYTMHISGPVFVYGFYPIAVKKHDKRNVENLNDSRFSENHPLRHQLSIVQHMLPPRVNAQPSVHQTNPPEGPSQRHLDTPAALTRLSRFDGKAERSALPGQARNNC